MPEIKFLNEKNYGKYIRQASQLILLHSDGHITREGYLKFRKLKRSHLKEEGTAVALALYQGYVVGVLACRNQGKDFAIVTVHRSYRQHKLGKKMLKKVIDKCGGFHCEVASDNMPSIKTCLSNGLVLYDAFKRRGKVVLRFKARVPAKAQVTESAEDSEAHESDVLAT